ncbi:MAG: 50S ribosomal protein L5 [SAR324 cluster bacterium]|uniref:50S ribosomal protein L5 n=1 Tax=SAR324 cluster bacterium TaxID=2024889 RepID=A0A2A4SLS2_9DELT|nr:MAG: 50S ribosomal protein L5 [SAR324 cluster bacterium]
MFLKKLTNSRRILRCSVYSNIHEISSSIEKVTLSYVQKENISLKALVKVSTLFELITGQRSFFIRSKKSLAALKIRRGVPVGLKTTLRGTYLSFFLLKLV